MQESELIELWRSYDRKLEENLILNRQNAQAITLIKIKSVVSSMAPIKIFVIVGSTIWLSFVGVVLYRAYVNVSPFFWYSIAIHAIILAFVIGVYIYQLVLIYQTDLGEALFDTQRRLARLKSSTLLIARLMFLHTPIWTTFSIPERIFEHPVWRLFKSLSQPFSSLQPCGFSLILNTRIVIKGGLHLSSGEISRIL